MSMERNQGETGRAGSATSGPETEPSDSRNEHVKQKLATEPHGYIADKIAILIRGLKWLTQGFWAGRQSESAASPRFADAAAGAAARTASEPSGPADSRRDQVAGPEPHLAPPLAHHHHRHGGSGSGSGSGGLLQAVHQHEPADQLHAPLTTSAKLRNAAVSTVEHALDEAAALQSSLGGAAAEELNKFRQEAHRGPKPTTSGGLPLTEN